VSHQIKLGTYDGSTPFETFIAKFRNAASYNQWTPEDGLAHMKACLTGNAANILWDTPASRVSTLTQLMDVLSTRFGNEGMAEKFRCELRTRRRQQDESLQVLHQDIQRLASLAFQGPWNEAVDVLARDAFIDALEDDEMAGKVREREPTSLDQAVRIAIRLESYKKSASSTIGKGEKCSFSQQQQARASQKTDDPVSNLLKAIQSLQSTMQAQIGNLQSKMESMENQRRYTKNVPSREGGEEQHRVLRNEKRCFKCAELGHFARVCPTKEQTQTRDETQSTSAKGSTLGPNDYAVYVDMRVGKITTSCLIDTGCEMSLLPGRLLMKGDQLEPHLQQVTAAILSRSLVKRSSRSNSTISHLKRKC
jgi:hypothetical protein